MDGDWVEGRLVDDDWVEDYKQTQAGRARRRRRLLIAAAAIVAAVALVAVGALVVSHRDTDAAGLPPGQSEAEVFLAAWSAGNLERMQSLVSDPAAHVAKDLEESTSGLHARRSTYTFTSMEGTGDRLTATFSATIEVGGLGPWTYQGRMPLVSTAAGYRVNWSVAVIHPELHPTMRLDRTRTRPERAPILGVNDQPLVGPRPAVTIGLWPAHIKDQAALTKTLSETLHLDPQVITKPLSAPGLKPDELIPLVTLPKDEYLKIKPIIYDIPGVNFPESTKRLPPITGFAAHVLGRAGEITAEKLAQMGPTYQQGDIVGLSGLEAQFETTLGGSPSGDVRVVDPTGAVTQVLQHVEGTPPAAVRTTLDTAAQLAAEKALAGVTSPAAFVAVDDAGNIRAAASRPLDDGFNRALLGTYPPGSTFKVVTAAALLGSGTSVDTPLECPATITVDGKEFHNAEAAHAEALSLTDAFAQSCNTAFISAASHLPANALHDAAARFGFGVDYDIGVKSAGGAFPAAASPTSTSGAAAAIGQGEVTASPMHLATVAAAARAGQWHAPVLVVGAGASGGGPASAAPLDPAVRTGLDTLLHAVVAHGTGTAAAVPGRDVAGKTGTAEFGTDTPPKTHAWFIGSSGALSVAVIVEGGGFGGDVAAPLAATFFAAVGS